jgi:hypothetical protein
MLELSCAFSPRTVCAACHTCCKLVRLARVDMGGGCSGSGHHARTSGARRALMA